jgi:hypothetical protein
MPSGHSTAAWAGLLFLSLVSRHLSARGTIADLRRLLVFEREAQGVLGLSTSVLENARVLRPPCEYFSRLENVFRES